MQQELVARARAGDHDAFTTLVAGSVDRLFNVARLILRSDELAEDAVQDALVGAWTALRGLRDPDRFDAWIHRLLVNACYRASRQERVRRGVEVRALPMDGARASDTQQADTQHTLAARDQLERGFRRLSPDQRAVLVVHFYVDLPDAQAAEVLDVPIGTFKSRLNRATVALRAALEADERQAVTREPIA
jgi:RNA polymerase sigma-70 factor, ECF subfamily